VLEIKTGACSTLATAPGPASGDKRHNSPIRLPDEDSNPAPVG
jgi:hypothetical protein